MTLGINQLMLCPPLDRLRPADPRRLAPIGCASSFVDPLGHHAHRKSDIAYVHVVLGIHGAKSYAGRRHIQSDCQPEIDSFSSLRLSNLN
jgi:hypothetical protein